MHGTRVVGRIVARAIHTINGVKQRNTRTDALVITIAESISHTTTLPANGLTFTILVELVVEGVNAKICVI